MRDAFYVAASGANCRGRHDNLQTSCASAFLRAIRINAFEESDFCAFNRLDASFSIVQSQAKFSCNAPAHF